jgi:hypothetical protein
MSNEHSDNLNGVEPPYLPDKETKSKYTLILDLDETIIHSVI